MSIRVTAFGDFNGVSRRHLKMMEEALLGRPPHPVHPRPENPENDTAWDEWNLIMGEINRKANEHAVIAIIFSCAACELYINSAASRRLGEAYFAEHIDRLTITSKWAVVPRLICGYSIDRSGRAWELLKKLVKCRNKLIHAKDMEVSNEKIASLRFASLVDSAREAIEALDTLADVAKGFDEEYRVYGLRASEGE